MAPNNDELMGPGSENAAQLAGGSRPTGLPSRTGSGGASAAGSVDAAAAADAVLVRTRVLRIAVFSIAAILAVAVSFGSGRAHAAWQQIAEFLSLQGKPEPSSANVLSEHEMETLDAMSPQSQAMLLMERSINHFHGANAEIEKRVENWRGKIKMDDPLRNLFMTGLNSDDLRVRAAALEVNIAARNLEKTSATIDRLEPDARAGAQGPRANALWNIGLLGNRGVEQQRAAQILLGSIHDSNVNVRYWAVEGLAYLGTDEVIQPLLEIFHDDPSPMIKERAACGLSQSGMLSERQRRSAVPKLLEYADDASLDATAQKWVFQMLRDITGQTLPHDASVWRSWYSGNTGDWKPVTRD